MKLKEQFDTTKLDEFCDYLTQELDNMATAEYKLKLVLVLVHIINESQKALAGINIDNSLKELKELVKNACEQTEKQKEVLKLRFDQDRQVRNIIDGTNADLQALDKEIEPLLARYESIVNTLVNIRDSMSPPARAVIQK